MRAILKQTTWLFLAQALGRVIGLFYTIFLARNLGVSDFGLFSSALAYFSLVSSVADFGFNRFLIREIARDHKKIPELLCNISLLRLTLGSVIFSLFAVGLYLLDPDKLRVSLTLLAVLAVLPQAISQTLDAIFVALQKLQYSSVALLILSLATTIFGVSLVSTGFGVVGTVVALILGQLVYLIALTFFLRVQKVRILAKITTSTIKQAILGSLPYGLLGILGLLYFRIDIILLTYLRGNFDAGIYGVAYRFLEAVVFVPSSLAAAFFPISIKLVTQSPEKIYKLYKKSIYLLFLIALPIAAAYWLLVPFIILRFLPQYLQAIKVLQILSLTIPFMFMISIQGMLLFSHERFLRPLLLMGFFNLILNILLNLYLIPKYSFVGSAWATLISDIVGFSIFLLYIRAKFIAIR